MAKSRAGFASKRSQNYSTKWLSNAMKSIGISTSQVIQEISPNIYEISKSGVDLSRSMITSMKRNNTSINRVSDQLRSNKYVRFAQTAYKNALTDIKSGNLNNTGRYMDDMNDSIEGLEDLGEGISFGDDGSDNVNVNVINQSGSNEAMLKMSDQLQKNAVGQAKMQKASMDAYIAVSAANMQQMNQLGGEIINQITNVNSNLAALVAYNNQNVTKFIEASLAYYDKAGSSVAANSSNSYSDKGKISAKDVLNSSSGGINMGQYKNYVKQQFKDMVDKSDVGLIKSILSDDSVLEMAASNPLGFMTTSLTRYMMPKILKTSLESMETTFTNFMPTILSQLADMASTEGNDFMSKFKRTFGQVFGLKTERIEKMQRSSVNREAIPFDGETKHAITEIITKELREQTGYLQIIASHYNKNAKAVMQRNQEYYSYRTNGYVKQDQINTDIANEIVDSIQTAFSNTKFGEAMMRIPNAIQGDSKKANAIRGEYNNTVREIFAAIEKSNKTVDLPFLIELINNTGADKTTKKDIIEYVKKLHEQDIDSFQSINVGRISAQGAANEAKKRIQNDSTAYHLNDSKFVEKDKDGNIRNIDDVINEVLNWGSGAKGRQKTNKIDIRSNLSGQSTSASSDKMNFSSNDLKTGVKGSIKNASEHATGIMRSLMNGDTKGVLEQGASFMTNQLSIITDMSKKFFLGDKDEAGKFKGGFLSSIANDTKAKFQKIGDDVKNGVMLKLFGKVKDKETGQYIKDEDSKGGLFGQVAGVFKKGLDGWTDALFGSNDDNREATQKSIVSKLKESAPNAAVGAALGAGVGIMSSGSLLGMLVGGPIAGAGMGAAVGLLSKNESFQNWLFGTKDKDTGERAGGLISKKTQDFFKDNKSFMMGSAAIGAVSGAITGGGFLGTLVGGPIAGAIIGMAGGIIKKSGVFDRFLFGDEKNGQKGLIKGVQDAWKSHFKNSDDKDLAASGAKAIGMTGLGTAAGGLIGTIVGGPVLGALAGFGLSVKAQSGNFKEWLFGKEDGLSLGNGKKVKKQGVIGIIGNTIDVNIIKPMKTQFKYMADDAMNVLEHKILAPFAFAAEIVADKAGGIVEKVTSGAETAFKKVTGTVGKAIGKAFDPFTRAIGKTMTKATDAAYKTIKTVASAPGAFITATIKTLKLKERFDNFLPVKAGKAFVKDVRNLIIKGIKGLFKGVFNVITAPFRGVWKLTKKVGSGIKSLGKKIGGIKIGDKSIGDRLQGVKNKFNGTEWAQNFKEAMANSGTFGTLSERMKLNAADYKKRKEEIENQKKENKRHVKNAQIIKRLTGGQFAEDSEEARTWLRFNKPDGLDKLNGTSITEEAEIAKNGKSTAGMSENNLESANLSDLNEEGKQTKLLYNIWTWLTGKFKKKDEDVPEEEKDHRKADKAELKGKAFDELAAEARERGIDFDDSTSEDELRQKLANDRTGERGYNPKEPSKLDQKRWSLKSMWKNTKNYFKNEFFANTRKVVKDRKNDKSQTEEAVDQASAASGENVEKHSIGGILKKGLHLIGEKGAELLNLDDDGAEVLSSDDTEDAAKQVKNKQNKRKKKLADFFKKRKKREEEEQAANLQEEVSTGTDNALEEQSDESLRNRMQSASYMVGAARNKEERRNANIEQNRAIMAKREDMRSDSQEKALKNAKTADELRKEVEEQKYRDQQLKNQAATIGAIKDTGNATKSFKDLWSGIFGKKGLITAAALLGYAWLKKHLPKLMSALEGLLGGAASVAGNTLSDLFKDFKWGQKNKSRTDGNTAEEQLEKNVKDIKNGNILTDSEGNATHQTEARTKLLARLGLNFINSGVKTPGAKLPGLLGKSARMANRQKSVFNVAKKTGSYIGKGISKVGNKIGSGLTSVGSKFFGRSAYEKATGKLVGSGMQFADDGSRILSATDFAKLTEGMGDTERTLYQVQNGFQILDDTETLGRKAITNTKKTLSNAKSKVLGKADDMAAAIAAKAKANDGVLSTISGYLDKFFNFIKDKFAKKTGSEITERALKFSPGSILKALKSKWASICEKISAKLTEITGAKVTAGIVSAGLSEVVFATIGGLNGVTGTAKLFQVDSDKVDGTMRLIAGIFGALTGTTFGSIIDVILSFAGDILNVDILHSLAVGMYKTIVGNDSKAAKNIDKYQDDWHDKYSKDQYASIKEQYETQKKAGIIGKDVSYEDFKTGVNEGKYEVSYTSFQDWNTQKNASLGDKITSGIEKGFKTVKNRVGSFLFGSKTYTDDNGNTYKKNSDGTYQVTSKDGKDLGYVSAKSIDTYKMKKNKKSGAVSKAKSVAKGVWDNSSVGTLVNFATGIKDKGVKNAAKDALKKTAVVKAGTWLFKKPKGKCFYAMDSSYYLSNGTHYSANGDQMDSITSDELESKISSGELKEGTATIDSGLSAKISAANEAVHKGWRIFTSHLSDFWDKTTTRAEENATKLADFAFKSAFRISAFLRGKKEHAYFNPNDGSYYVAAGDGYTHYSANGDVIEENVDANGVEVAFTAGSLTEGTVRGEAGWKTTLKEAGNALEETMTKGATALYNGFNSLKTKAGEVITGIVRAGGVRQYIGGLFKSSKTMGLFDTNGSYYVMQSDGTFTYYNANGDVLKTKVPASEVDELKSLGLLTSHKVKKDSAAKKAINSIQKAVTDAWNTVKRTVTSAWKSFKSFITGKGGTGGGFGYFRKAQSGSGRGRLSAKRVLGGFGPDELNGASYFSQNDNRWKDASYNIGLDQATMGDSGCGPTAMAMAINTARKGGNVTPMEMANIAKVTGNRDETGTNADFIGQSAALMGMNSEERMNPSASDISAQLSTGNPVVMLGRNTGSGNNPYTMSGHYVVAVGQKPNGDVIINDPRGKSYSKTYNINNLANATGSSWTVGNNTNIGGSGIRGRIGGLGRNLVNKIKGGFGTARDTWVGIVQATKKAIAAQKPGYNQSGWINVTVGGKTVRTRQDCSGMVTTAAKFFGAVDDSVEMWTGVMLDSSSPLNSKGCFQLMQFPGWESLAIGDILVNNGHTEVFAGLKDGQHYVYNCGSTSSVNNPGATISGHSSYDVIWRPVKPGPNCVSNVSVDYSGGFTGADGVGTSTDASVGGSTSNESKLSQLTSYIGNFMTEFGSRVLTGDTNNTDYSSVLSGVMNSGSSSDGSVSGVADDGSAVSSGNQTAMKGQTINLPSGLGTQNSYMGWQCITAPSSTQYKLRQQAGQNFDSNGYGKINGRYTIATTTTYGNVGDYLDVKRSDGSVLKAVIADIKNQNDDRCNKWGHNYGKCVVEFVVDKNSWYQSDGNGGQVGYSRINQTDPGRNTNSVVSITNQGSYFSGGAGKGRPVKGGSGLMSRYTNDGRYGSTLSRRNRYRVDHAKKIAIGGFGASVNTASGFGSTMADKTGYANVYIKTTKDNSTQELLANAIEILALIANNTLNTSTRLAAMSKLNQLTGKNNQSNNVIITGNNSSNGNTAAISQPAATTRNTGEATARAIARGGY